MRNIVFTDHAIKRLERLTFHKNPTKNLDAAMRLLANAKKILVDTIRGNTHYKRGTYIFVVKETKKEIVVITILNKAI